MGLLVCIAAMSESFEIQRVLSNLLSAGFSLCDGEATVIFYKSPDDYEPICLPIEEALAAINAAYCKEGFEGLTIRTPYCNEQSWSVTIRGLDWQFLLGLNSSAGHLALSSGHVAKLMQSLGTQEFAINSLTPTRLSGPRRRNLTMKSSGRPMSLFAQTTIGGGRRLFRR